MPQSSEILNASALSNESVDINNLTKIAIFSSNAIFGDQPNLFPISPNLEGDIKCRGRAGRLQPASSAGVSCQTAAAICVISAIAPLFLVQ